MFPHKKELKSVQKEKKFRICALLVFLLISIINLHGQDYLINFEGSGESTSVTNVKVENTTQGTELIMSGSDVLHLESVITGIEQTGNNTKNGIRFYPNPMTDNTRMQFILPESGETVITMYDLSGRIILQKQDFLSHGEHTYRLEGINNGIYFITIRIGRYSASGRLICEGSQKGGMKIVYENTTAEQKEISDSKGTNAETVMQYTTGDRLKLTGISGNYSTIKTDIPTQNKTITFNFLACTDGDYNNYPVIELGTQIWMAENLKTTKYLNGELIGTTTSDISGESTPKYQWAYDDNESNAAIYGRLYTWYTVIDGRNVCPTGWHIPTDTEWETLKSYLGIESDAVAKLKETGTTHWQSPNTGATNETGFTAIPDGYRRDTAVYASIHVSCYFWSSSLNQYNTEWAWGQGMYFDSTVMLRGGHWKRYGVSVRCMKD